MKTALGLSTLLMLLSLSLTNITAAADHVIELENNRFDIVFDGVLTKHFVFTRLPTEKKFYLSYSSSSPTAQIRYDDTQLKLVFRRVQTQTLYLKHNGQIKTLYFSLDTRPEVKSQLPPSPNNS